MISTSLSLRGRWSMKENALKGKAVDSEVKQMPMMLGIKRMKTSMENV